MSNSEEQAHIEKTEETPLEELQKRLQRIELAIKADKLREDWEKSKTRIVYVSTTTYLIALIFMFSISIERPYINALVPTVLYVFSYVSFPQVKKWWIHNHLENKAEEEKQVERKQKEVVNEIREQKGNS